MKLYCQDLYLKMTTADCQCLPFPYRTMLKVQSECFLALVATVSHLSYRGTNRNYQEIRTLQQPRSSFPCPVWEGIVFDGSLFMCVIIDYWRISDNLWCRSGVISPNAALRLVSWGWTRPLAERFTTPITRMCQSRESPAPGVEKWRSLTTIALS